MDERLRRALVWFATAVLVLVTAYVVARVVMPAIANALTAFFLNPGVLIALWLLWSFKRRGSKR